MLEQNNNHIKDLLPSIEYLKQSIDQDPFISKASLLLNIKMLRGGLCSGFCIDYGRHVISHRNSKILPNYIKALQRKFEKVGKNSKKFINRIEDYQSLQPIYYQETQSNLELALQKKQIIESLIPDLKLTSLVLLCLFNKKIVMQLFYILLKIIIKK